MKSRITVSLDEEIVQKLGDINDESGAPISTIINRILKKEFKMK